MRKVHTYENTNTDKKAVVYRDVENEEYVVKFYVSGKYQVDADYHTDDKGDATDTAKHWTGVK